MPVYTPNPIETAYIKLPPEIAALVEQLAENTHENWAQERMRSGWKYGPLRDDGQKTHPGLVPYSDLSQEEKKYDRITSMETLKAIVALGWKIDR